MSGEVGDLNSSLEDLQKAKANNDKRLRSVEEQLNEATARVTEYEASIAALQSAQAKATSENSELSSQLSEAESKVGSLMKAKSALESQVEDLQSELQSETSVSSGTLLHSYTQWSSTFTQIKVLYNECIYTHIQSPCNELHIQLRLTFNNRPSRMPSRNTVRCPMSSPTPKSLWKKRWRGRRPCRSS